MKPSGVSVTYSNGDTISVTQTDYDQFGPASETLYKLTLRAFGAGPLPLLETLPKSSRHLGSPLACSKLISSDPNTHAVRIDLERAPNATQWAAFLETLYATLME